MRKLLVFIALLAAPVLAQDDAQLLADLSGGGQVLRSDDGYVVRDARGALIRWVRTDTGYEATVKGRVIRVISEDGRLKLDSETAATIRRSEGLESRKVRQVRASRD